MKALQLFNELRRHGKLADKRHPMYDTNRFGKIAMRLVAAMMIGYLIFFGTLMALALGEESREAYHLMGGGFVIILMLDFLIRIPAQKTPTQEIKPYLLMPVKRNRVVDFLLLRSALDGFNLFWLFFFVPFSFLTVFKFYGVLGVLFYCFGVWLLSIFNNYWYLLCKTLIGEHLAWTLLPLAVYGGLAAALFIPDESPLFYAFMLLSDGFVKGNPLAYGIVILAIALLFFINRLVMIRLFYDEVNKVEDVKVRTSDYNFFERYGEVGEYMRLELKMLLRNKTCKNQMRMIVVIVIAFSLILSFSEVYDGGMTRFIIVYNFAVFGMMYLVNLMSYEGNYIDGLMSRKESILTLLTAKYIFYSLAVLIPAILMIPTVIEGKVELMTIVAWILFTAGPIYFALFQLAVYNKKTTPLNVKLTGRQNMGTGVQNLISFGAFGVPLIIYSLLLLFFSETATNIILSVVGLAFIATHKYWIRNVYNRFMARRYDNMTGFRDSRIRI
jgi:hypothetical protein